MNSEVTANDRLVDRIARNTALDPIADALAPGLRNALDSAGPLEPLASFLHGTPLGHPLHPAVTDIPIGAWSLAVIFDALEASGNPEFARASDVAIGVGLAGGVLAIASGMTEWADTKDDPRRLGMAHALLNTVGFSCYVASLVLRGRGNRAAGLATAFAGFAISAFAAYLGGELSFGMRLGTKHTAFPNDPAADFTPVLPVIELKDKPLRVDTGGIAMLLSRDTAGQISAISAICTHRGAALEEGEFAGGCVTCPWHHAQFLLATGAVERGPASFPLAQFETRVKGAMIEVRAAYRTK